MKVVYKKSMVDQLLDAKAEATLEGKEIDHIALTSKEWAQLRSELGYNSWGVGIHGLLTPNRIRFDGMNICKDIEEVDQ